MHGNTGTALCTCIVYTRTVLLWKCKFSKTDIFYVHIIINTDPFLKKNLICYFLFPARNWSSSYSDIFNIYTSTNSQNNSILVENTASWFVLSHLECGYPVIHYLPTSTEFCEASKFYAGTMPGKVPSIITCVMLHTVRKFNGLCYVAKFSTIFLYLTKLYVS